MNWNKLIVVVAAALLIVGTWLTYDVFLKRGQEVDCGNGDIRHQIDLRDFTTDYWVYAAAFELSLADKGKLAARLDPKQLQALSEGMQQGKEFRKFVVAGYNSCAIGKMQYAEYGARFQALDSLARQIDSLAGQQPPDQARLAELVRQYITLSQSLGETPP
ncbi:MAG: hypothetical protein V4446_02680 [Pseudomonadota bacterium]